MFFYLHKELKAVISASILVIFPPFSEVPATGATGNSYNSQIKTMITLWGAFVHLEMLKRKCRGDWSCDLRVFVQISEEPSFGPISNVVPMGFNSLVYKSNLPPAAR